MKEKRYPLVYLQYRVKGSKPDIKPIRHGNSKDIDDSTYYRTKQSRKELIMEKAKEFKPTKAFNKVFDERGGIRGCTSVGDMPRNRKQVRNARYKLSDPQPKKDTLYEVMKMCIDDQSRADPFVRCVQAAPEATCVLATNNQLHDLERFCTGSGVFSIPHST